MVIYPLLLLQIHTMLHNEWILTGTRLPTFFATETITYDSFSASIRIYRIWNWANRTQPVADSLSRLLLFIGSSSLNNHSPFLTYNTRYGSGRRLLSQNGQGSVRDAQSSYSWNLRHAFWFRVFHRVRLMLSLNKSLQERFEQGLVSALILHFHEGT